MSRQDPTPRATPRETPRDEEGKDVGNAVNDVARGGISPRRVAVLSIPKKHRAHPHPVGSLDIMREGITYEESFGGRAPCPA